MARVAIVVVSYESSEVIGGCLEAALRIPDAELLVVDNSPNDDTRKVVAGYGVRLLANARNAGFAGGVNQGVRASSAPLILLLNPDVRVETNIDALIACFADGAVGGAGGLLVGEDGKPQAGFMARQLPTATALAFEALGVNRLWPGNPVNWQYRCRGKDPMAATFVDQPAGAFFMFRRSAWEEIGGFDERFWPVWFEDVDFCARMRAAGHLVRYEPGARAVHRGGHSVGAIPLEIREKYWYGSLLKYAAKHYHPVAFGLVCLSVAAGAAGRAVLGFPRGGLRVFGVYSSVIRLALGSMLGFRRSV